MVTDAALLAQPSLRGTCTSSQSGMAGVTTCELDAGHAGLHQGRLWNNPAAELSTWRVAGTWVCTPPFFIPASGEAEPEAPAGPESTGLLVLLESGHVVRTTEAIPAELYRCPRISCWLLQPRERTTPCPTCAAPICSRCFRCGGLWAHVPSGELAYASDREPTKRRGRPGTGERDSGS